MKTMLRSQAFEMRSFRFKRPRIPKFRERGFLFFYKFNITGNSLLHTALGLINFKGLNPKHTYRYACLKNSRSRSPIF